jgi:hypothetical protein
VATEDKDAALPKCEEALDKLSTRVAQLQRRRCTSPTTSCSNSAFQRNANQQEATCPNSVG